MADGQMGRLIMDGCMMDNGWMDVWMMDKWLMDGWMVPPGAPPSAGEHSDMCLCRGHVRAIMTPWMGGAWRWRPWWRPWIRLVPGDRQKLLYLESR